MSTAADKEFFACLALRHCPGLGPRRALPLLTHYGTAYDAVQDAGRWLGLGLLREPDLARSFLAEAWRPEAEEEFRAARTLGLSRLCWGDARYPELLRQIPDPPLVLYYAGDAGLLANPAVAVVGARECTNLGLTSAERISAGLSAAGVTVVSGLAVGIDRQAHLGGLSGPGSSIAVLGAGLDLDYPPQNADVRKVLVERGLVLTEYGPGTPPRPSNFPVRNRIISGLSLGVVVAEAASKSGSLITARLALDQGREVFAVPGPLGQPAFVGCNDLIRQGACLVDKAEDILESLRFALRLSLGDLPPAPPDFRAPDLPPARPQQEEPLRPVRPAKAKGKAKAAKPRQQRPGPEIPADLPPLERDLLGLLRRDRKAHIDVLCRELGRGSAEVGSALLLLEMKSLIRQWPGMCYTLFEAEEAYGN